MQPWSDPWLPDATKDGTLKTLADAYPQGAALQISSEMAWNMVRGKTGFTTLFPDDMDELAYVRHNWIGIARTSSIPGPVLSSLNPDTVAAGSGDLTVAVAGSNFQEGAVVVAGVDLATTFVSSTSLSAILPAASLADPSVLYLVVRNPDEQTSGEQPFTVT